MEAQGRAEQLPFPLSNLASGEYETPAGRVTRTTGMLARGNAISAWRQAQSPLVPSMPSAAASTHAFAAFPQPGINAAAAAASVDAALNKAKRDNSRKGGRQSRGGRSNRGGANRRDWKHQKPAAAASPGNDGKQSVWNRLDQSGKTPDGGRGAGTWKPRGRGRGRGRGGRN